MEKAGARVKIAVDPIVFQITGIFMFMALALRIERIRKKIDCARTKIMTQAASKYKKVLFGLNIFINLILP